MKNQTKFTEKGFKTIIKDEKLTTLFWWKIKQIKYKTLKKSKKFFKVTFLKKLHALILLKNSERTCTVDFTQAEVLHVHTLPAIVKQNSKIKDAKLSQR